MKNSFTQFPAKHPITNQDSFCFRPMLPIDIGFRERWLSNEMGIVGIDALLDSGADKCMSPLWIADVLKIPKIYRKKGTTRGIEDNPQTTYYTNVQLKVCGHVIDVCIGFMERLPHPLLGREDFLNFFDVKIDYPNFFELTLKVPLQ